MFKKHEGTLLNRRKGAIQQPKKVVFEKEV